MEAPTGPSTTESAASAGAEDKIKLRKWNAVATWSFGDGVACTFVPFAFLSAYGLSIQSTRTCAPSAGMIWMTSVSVLLSAACADPPSKLLFFQALIVV